MKKSGKRIIDISFKDVKSYLIEERYKIKKEVESFIDLPEIMFSNMSPVFFVSTGRAGSELLVKLMNESKIGNVYHEPRPRMFYSSKLVFEKNVDIQTKKIAYLSARYDLLKKSYLEEKRFIETNNRNSFFMGALGEIFPKAKFIQIVRHPGDFVRSGIRRKYYSGNENDDSRITPQINDRYNKEWHKLTDIEKIGWLWNATYNYIENEKSNINVENLIMVKSEDLFSNPQTYNEICAFLNHDSLSERKISSIIKKPVNKQKQSIYPKWTDWSERDKNSLIKMTPLGAKYGYWK